MRNQCSIPLCTSFVHGRGLCIKHYRRWQVHGDPLFNYQVPPIEQRFWAKVDPCRTDGCFIWTANTDKHGYGRLQLNSRSSLAHHFLLGRPPNGLQYDHVKERGCNNRNCVNPEHLELVTPQVNVLRGDGPAARNHRRAVAKREALARIEQTQKGQP